MSPDLPEEKKRREPLRLKWYEWLDAHPRVATLVEDSELSLELDLLRWRLCFRPQFDWDNSWSTWCSLYISAGPLHFRFAIGHTDY